MTSPITPGPWGTIRNRWRAYEAAQGGAGTREQIEEILYDKAYSWELQPGSDVMATCVGVLPKIGVSGSYTCYGGLVTVPATTVPEVVVNGGHWMLIDPETVLTADAAMNIDGGYFGLDDAPAGLYLAVWYGNPDPGPPYAFPAGWTPGNTTGSGPVLPLVKDVPGSFRVYASYVDIAEGSGVPASWAVYAYGTDFLDPSGMAINPPLAVGAYLGAKIQYYEEGVADPTGVPTAMPSGWTVRPFGIGPIAATDENAGGLIGDVAYVVSGYVDNTDQATAALSGGAFHGFAEYESSITMQAGDTFKSPNDSLTYRAVTSGVVVFNTMALDEEATTTELELATAVDYWPFIERYDLAAKKWLPRIPLPDLGEGNYFATEGGIAGVIDGKLYFGGGDGDVVTGNEFFVYDPADDSITRLADLDEFNYPDYNTYWTLNGKLWHWSYDGLVFVYDPADDAAGWVSYEPTVDVAVGISPGQYARDMIQGFAVDGKAVWVYNGRAFSFDSATMTLTQKASTPRSQGSGPNLLIDGKIHEFATGAQGGPKVYDPLADTWTARTDLTNNPGSYYSGEYVGVIYQGAPYILSAITGEGGNLDVGVSGLTDVAFDKPRPSRLQDIQTPLEIAEGIKPVAYFRATDPLIGTAATFGHMAFMWPVYPGAAQQFDATVVLGAGDSFECAMFTDKSLQHEMTWAETTPKFRLRYTITSEDGAHFALMEASGGTVESGITLINDFGSFMAAFAGTYKFRMNIEPL